MPRVTAAKRTELESFWRGHLDGWRRSDLNQREYCELHGLPLKRFGNWRAKLRHEEPASAGKLLYRRGGRLKHMSKHMRKEIPSAPSGYIPSARSGGPGRRRNFSEADTLVVDCPPQPVFPATDLDDHLIEMPASNWHADGFGEDYGRSAARTSETSAVPSRSTRRCHARPAGLRRREMTA